MENKSPTSKTERKSALMIQNVPVELKTIKDGDGNLYFPTLKQHPKIEVKHFNMVENKQTNKQQKRKKVQARRVLY